MEYKIIITLLAESQLEGIADYIQNELHEPKTAADIVRGLREEICKLSCYPSRHGLYEDAVLAKLGVRKQYFKNYIIFYRVQEEIHTVEIVSVLHMRVDARSSLYRSFTQMP